jgi:hypothetical protein
MNDKKGFLLEVKAGDHVFVQQHNYTPHIERVARVTATQIVVVHGTSHESRFDRAEGWRKGHSLGYRIMGIANAEEIADAEKKKAEKQRESAERARRDETIEAERRRLNAVLPKDCWAHHDSAADADKAWHLNIDNLTSAQVEAIAKALKAAGLSQRPKEE